jgi:hypothetical protein
MMGILQNIAKILFAIFAMALITWEPKLPPKLNIQQIEDTVVIHKGYLHYDSLVLPLNQIPPVKDLHTVAKGVVGNWSKLFIAVKIEESGHDGQNSFYALNYHNLTGMRYPTKRKTTAVGKGYDYYAIYSNWYQSMVDFKLYLNYMEATHYLKYKRYPNNEKEFIQFLYGSFNVYSKWRNDVFYILDNFNFE